MFAIEVKNLEKQYQSKKVLKGINLTVNKGDIFGFLGRNGAGKSTFIHILTGITQKSKGNFEILGESDHNLDLIKKKIGVMPDTSNLYQHMKALDFLKYMAELKEDKRNRQGLIDLLNQVGLFNVEKQKIKSFSFGMKKKISIAQALLGNPELIFLDEPTSGLDPESGIEIQKLLLKLKNEGKTIFLTSHNLNEIEKVCDQVAIMNEGRIVKIGTVEKLTRSAKESIQIHIRTSPLINKQQFNKLFPTSLDLQAKYIKQHQNFSIIELNDEEIIPTIVERLGTNHFKIYEVRIENQTLEDVFMNV